MRPNGVLPRWGDQVFWTRFLVAAVLTSMVCYRLTSTVADPDLWGYLAFGRLFWETSAFPYEDVFTYVPTLHPWVYHEWLTGVLFYPLYQHLGGSGLQIIKYSLGLLTLGLVYLTARKRGADPLSAALGIFLVHSLMRLGYSPVRAQIFTFAFFALTLYLLETVRQEGRWWRLGLLIPLQVLWCNLHGGFAAGLGLMALYALGETLSRRPAAPFWLILGPAALATLINPYGLKFWTYMVEAVALPRPMIKEWASVVTTFQEQGLRGDILLFVLLNLVAVIWLIRFREVTAGLALLVSMYLGWKHLRHQVLFGILLAAYIPPLLSTYLEDLKSKAWIRESLRRLGWKPAALLGMGLTVYYSFLCLRQSPLDLKVPPEPGLESETDIYYPVGAISYIKRRQLSGRVLTHFDWGEYAIWTLYPHCRVALDGRFETVYPQEVADEYFDFIYGFPGWQLFLKKYPADMILIYPRSKTHYLLLKEPDWRQVYGDPGCALFLRKDYAMEVKRLSRSAQGGIPLSPPRSNSPRKEPE